MSYFGYNNNIDEFETSMYLLHSQQFQERKNNLPKNFHLLNLNLWGIDKEFFQYSFLSERLPHLVKMMLYYQPEIITLQELSPTAHEYFLQSDLSQHYRFLEKKILWEQRDNVSVTILTKKHLSRGQGRVYCLHGEQRYTMATLEVGDVLIAAFHLQAGSSASKGVHLDSADKYHQSRQEMLNLIKNELPQSKKIILAGDCNFDHTGSPKDWPELNTFRTLGWQDVWSFLHPKTKYGWTEDSTRNTMRWNVKQQDRHCRYDIIAISGPCLIPKQIKLIGTEPAFAIKKEKLLAYNHYLKLDPDRLKLNQEGLLDWFLSDHFGLLAEFAEN